MYLNATQQDNLITLLIFDDDSAGIIRGAVELDLFEGDYRDVVRRIYDYIDRYGTAPKDHVADILDDILNGNDEDKAQVYNSLLENSAALHENINIDYVMNTLAAFTRRQHLKNGIIDAAELLQASESEEALEQVEVIMAAAMRRRLDLFDPGIFLSDTESVLDFLNIEDNEGLPIGIPEIDSKDLGPKRKELHLFIASTGMGKTWWFIHLAKYAFLNNLRVCHISLEVDERQLTQRYMQNFFAMTKRRESLRLPVLEKDTLGRLLDISFEKISPELSMTDSNIREQLEDRIGDWGTRLGNLVIKQFPTSALTVNGLKAYLDSLESRENFVPDILFVDYADLMRLNALNYRLELGQLYKELRGIGVERNIAVATASQSHRAGVKAKLLTVDTVAEDWSKAATADTIFTYSQTDAEKELGLARLYVAKGRTDVDKFTTLITQDYRMGQFVLDSAPMASRYKSILSAIVGDEESYYEEDN